MKYRHIILLILLVSANAVSCKREDIPEPLPNIQVRAGAIGTKGLLNSGGLSVDGTQVKVFDYISNFSGTIVSGGTQLTPGQDGTIKYIDDTIEYDGTNSKWDFVTGDTYPWTRTGTHSFFGWTTKVADTNSSTSASLLATDLFGTAGNDDVNKFGFIYESKTLNIPATTMTTTTTQIDFCYSDIVQKTSSFREAVEIPFHHLFTGLSLAIENKSDDEIYIQSVETKGIANSKKATVDFSGTGTPTPTYTRTSAPTNLIPSWGTAKTLVKNAGIDLWTGNSYDSSNPNYILMWPQKWDEDICGSGVSTLAGVIVHYTIKDIDGAFTSTINFQDIEALQESATGFQAGHRYRLVLQFEGKQFILTLKVDPWDYVKDDYDYNTSTIGAAGGSSHEGTLWLYKNGQENDTNSLANPSNNKPRVVPLSDAPNGEILGVFYIGSPTQGNWRVELTPYDAARYFTITPDSGVIESDHTNNGRTTFTVKANTSEILTATQTAYFRILISINNEWRDANSEFNRKNWGVSRVYE